MKVPVHVVRGVRRRGSYCRFLAPVRLHGKAVVTVWVIGVALAAATLLGCSSSGRPPASPALELQLRSLKGDNGLYANPTAKAQRTPTLDATAYALSVLRAGDVELKYSVQPESLGPLSVAAVAAQPIFGRWWLGLIFKATGTTLAPDPALPPALLEGLARAGRSEQGAPESDPAQTLAEVATALDVLDGADAPPDQSVRASVETFIHAREAALANPYQAWNLARAERSLGMDPRAVPAYLDSWWRVHGEGLKRFLSDEELLDAYGFVEAARLVGYPIADKVVRLESVLTPSIDEANDPFVAFYATLAWRDLGGGTGPIQPMAKALAARQLPTGLFPSTSRIIGTIEASFNTITALRQIGPVKPDKKLVDSLETLLRSQPTGVDPLTVAHALLVEQVVGRRVPAEQLARAVDELVAAVPRQVTVDNVQQWMAMVAALQKFHAIVPKFEVKEWPVQSREQVFKFSLLVNGETIVGRPVVSAGMRAEGIRAATSELVAPPAHMSVFELAAIVEALRESSVAPPVPATELRSRLQALRGCVAFSELYRPSDGDSDCDSNATAVALELDTRLASAGASR